MSKSKEMRAKIRANKAAKAKLAGELTSYGISPIVANYKIQEIYELGVRHWCVFYDNRYVSIHDSTLEANQEIIRLIRSD